MTPDTSSFMIAGFAVILGGMVLYIATLFIRNMKVKKALSALKDLEEESQKQM
jgi:hypothetical protein